MFFGNGGYDWLTLYNMPVRYRDFIYNQIKEHFEKQKETAEKQKKSPKGTPPPKAAGPPTYVSKAPRK